KETEAGRGDEEERSGVTEGGGEKRRNKPVSSDTSCSFSPALQINSFHAGKTQLDPGRIGKATSYHVHIAYNYSPCGAQKLLLNSDLPHTELVDLSQTLWRWGKTKGCTRETLIERWASNPYVCCFVKVKHHATAERALKINIPLRTTTFFFLHMSTRAYSGHTFLCLCLLYSNLAST
ncbi:hypothetical protein ATANTOWER_011039, partial [Ataeniobius toweri]|nr:hypothetical protein [Ataeniobius toweri]